jgi:hypothetical protein
MRKPWYQKLITTYIPIIVVGFLFVGSILDALSNSIELIRPTTTYIGTVIAVLVLIILLIFLKRNPVSWITEDGQTIRVKSLGPVPVLATFGVILALWVPRFIGQETSSINANNSSIEQTVIELATAQAEQQKVILQVATAQVAGSLLNYDSLAITATAIEKQVISLQETIVVLTQLPYEAPPSATISLTPPQLNALNIKPTIAGEIVPLLTAIQDLNVRSGPGLSYDIVGTLEENEQAILIGYTGLSEGNLYWLIACPEEIEATDCWVSGGDEFSQVGNFASVPTIFVTNTPTRIPTLKFTLSPSLPTQTPKPTTPTPLPPSKTPQISHAVTNPPPIPVSETAPPPIVTPATAPPPVVTPATAEPPPP